MEEKDLNYIKVKARPPFCCVYANSLQMINAGERLIVNNRSFGYLSNRIVFYLLNLHIKSRRTYFARVSAPPSTSIHSMYSDDIWATRPVFLPEPVPTKQMPPYRN